MLQWHWIAHPSDLQKWWGRSPQWIGLDTEFIRERTYWPQLALVQMAIAEDVLLIDFQVAGMQDALRPWLTAPQILKVMHSAGEDCVAFHHGCGAVPAPLFDTQLAATLTGMGQMLSYQKLVARVTGVELIKGETRSDWQQRPLSSAQLHYAADDVRYLSPLYQSLRTALERQQRMQWLEEDCARLLAQCCADDEGRGYDYSSRSARALDSAAHHRLRRILHWREQSARRLDLPRNWIIDNALAQKLALHPPQTIAALKQRLRGHRLAVQNSVEPIWAALISPDQTEATARANAIDAAKMPQLVKKMQRIVARHSQALEVPETFLASRRHLETLIAEQAWPLALGQWRRSLLETPLLNALREEIIACHGTTAYEQNE